MKKYDCSKTLDYFHELKRLCETNTTCCKRAFTGFNQNDIDVLQKDIDVLQKDIDVLQKWSDEHPEKTRAEAFLDRVPTYIRVSVTLSDGRQIDRPYFPCWGATIGRHDCCYRGSCNDCWGAPYHGEYEREEKTND